MSVYALHPMYMNLHKMELPGTTFPDTLKRELDATRDELNADKTAPLDYEAVMAAKLRLLRCIFDATGASVMATPGFMHFFSENEYGEYGIRTSLVLTVVFVGSG